MITSNHPGREVTRATRKDLEKRLLLALGLEDRNVTFIGMVFLPDRPPTVTVTMELSEDMTDNVIQVTENYTLEPKG